MRNKKPQTAGLRQGDIMSKKSMQDNSKTVKGADIQHKKTEKDSKSLKHQESRGRIQSKVKIANRDKFKSTAKRSVERYKEVIKELKKY